MKLFVGTSGFGYAEWAGKFYPKGLEPEERLRYYARRMNATEVNSTFYAMPRPALLRSWERQVPKNFSFSYKAPAVITHLRRLLGAAGPLDVFLGAVGPRYGVVVFQLPPSFKKDAERLRAFLELLPEGRFALEFRHPSWFDDEVLALLKKRRVALVHNDADVKGCPLVATAPFMVLKLRRTRYTDAELSAWARRLKTMRTAYVFFKHEETASGPKLAARLVQKVRAQRPSARARSAPLERPRRPVKKRR